MQVAGQVVGYLGVIPVGLGLSVDVKNYQTLAIA